MLASRDLFQYLAKRLLPKAALAWKKQIETSNAALEAQMQDITSRMEAAEAKGREHERKLTLHQREIEFSGKALFRLTAEAALLAKLPQQVCDALRNLAEAAEFSVHYRGGHLSIALPQDSGLPMGRGHVSRSSAEAPGTSILLIRSDGREIDLTPHLSTSHLHDLIEACLAQFRTNPSDPLFTRDHELSLTHLQALGQTPCLGPHVACELDRSLVPFSLPEELGRRVPAEPKRRSVLFARNCYYNFSFLAQALRKRGWDAVTLSTDPPESQTHAYSHGQDLHIFDPDPTLHREKLSGFLARIPERFGIVHTYGVFGLPIVPTPNPQRPWDVLELKRHQVLLGYSHSGCMDGVRQSVFREWSGDMCKTCAWEHDPSVCSDDRNRRWGELASSWLDLFCCETDPIIDFKASKNVFRAPLTFAVNREFWSPELDVPERLRVERQEGEVLIYHAVGNFKLRQKNGNNAKGTGFVMQAIERLKKEGFKVRLHFVDDVPTRDNRFVQQQSDIIVDQIMYGRYGAIAREGMMLGKPVVGRVNKQDRPGVPATQCILETPIVHADPDTVYDVLKELVENETMRRQVGEASRKHAIKWWSDEVLAGRFERVYDYIREHGAVPPESFLEPA